MEAADEIIEQMKNFDLERRIVDLPFEGRERRHEIGGTI